MHMYSLSLKLKQQQHRTKAWKKKKNKTTPFFLYKKQPLFLSLHRKAVCSDSWFLSSKSGNENEGAWGVWMFSMLLSPSGDAHIGPSVTYLAAGGGYASWGHTGESQGKDCYLQREMERWDISYISVHRWNTSLLKLPATVFFPVT